MGKVEENIEKQTFNLTRKEACKEIDYLFRKFLCKNGDFFNEKKLFHYKCRELESGREFCNEELLIVNYEMVMISEIIDVLLNSSELSRQHSVMIIIYNKLLELQDEAREINQKFNVDLESFKFLEKNRILVRQRCLENDIPL